MNSLKVIENLFYNYLSWKGEKKCNSNKKSNFLIHIFFYNFVYGKYCFLRKKTYNNRKTSFNQKKILNQLFLHIYMKNISTMNSIKLFKQLQQIKTKKIYILFSFNINEKLF